MRVSVFECGCAHGCESERERESINLFYNEDKIESRYGRVKDKNAIKWPFPFRRISKNGKNGLLGTICLNSLGIKDI